MAARSDRQWLGGMGQHVRTARLQRGLTQRELAILAGLHRTYIGGVERGERNVTVLGLRKIAIALDVSPAELLRDLPANRSGSPPIASETR